MPRRKHHHKKDNVFFFKSTPQFLKIAELAHLNKEFNHKTNSKESIKLLPPQISDTVITNGGFHKSQQDRLNFTNNGIYAYSKCLAQDVVQIDVHSLLPTWAFNLRLLDHKHKQLFLRKKEIEATPNYIDNKRLVNERKRDKDSLNRFCSENGKTKNEQYVNRLRCTYSGMNMIYDMLQFWGLENVINCVNDGFIIRINTRDFDKKYQQFQRCYQRKISQLTFSMKKWDYALIKNDQEYLLFNSLTDYKCRNHCFDVRANYYAMNGESLRKAEENNNVDPLTLAKAEKQEREAVYIVDKQVFDQDPFNKATKENMERLDEVKKIMNEAGIQDVNHGILQPHYYRFELDKNDSQQIKDYINKIARSMLSNQIFMLKNPPASTVNLFGQVIKAAEINDMEQYLRDHKNVTVNDFVPPIIRPAIVSIDDWIKQLLNDKEIKHNLYLYNSVAIVLQVWATENKHDPNTIIKKLNDALVNDRFSNLSIADKVYNDPATILVDNQLMALNEHHVYTADSKAVNSIIDKYIDASGKRFIRNSRNNVYELLNNNKYKNSKLDIGFKSENQTIWIDNKGVHTENPLLKKIGNYVNVDYINYEADKDLFNSEEYSQVEAFLTHISDGCYRQITCMLALIVLQDPNIVPTLRRAFILYGVPGSGKTVLAKLLCKIFDEPNRPSRILCSEPNINKVFTDPNLIDANDTKKGKLVLWFDDFQSDGRSNEIKRNVGTVINAVTSNEAKTGAAKFQQYHDIKLPSLIVLSTNDVPQIKHIGTVDRIFVIKSSKRLTDDPNISFSSNIDAWINNKKVQEAFFCIILNTAVDILNMSKDEAKSIFDKSNSAQSALSNLNSSIEAFFEEQNITSLYDLVGMQAKKLFDVYLEGEKNFAYATTYRAFCDQIEGLGLNLRRKHFNHKNYQKVICSKNDNLTQEKLNLMLKENELSPDQVEYWDNEIHRQRGKVSSWHCGYDELKEKYKNDQKLFMPFEF